MVRAVDADGRSLYDRRNRGCHPPVWRSFERPFHHDAIRGNLQARAAALTARYGALGLDARGVFDLLLRYAISEDGALHGEKYYRTVSEDFAATRPGLRWRHVTALARVTASEYGRPAAGMEQARELLRT